MMAQADRQCASTIDEGQSGPPMAAAAFVESSIVSSFDEYDCTDVGVRAIVAPQSVRMRHGEGGQTSPPSEHLEKPKPSKKNPRVGTNGEREVDVEGERQIDAEIGNATETTQSLHSIAISRGDDAGGAACFSCGDLRAGSFTRASAVIPHYGSAVILSFSCDACGYSYAKVSSTEYSDSGK